MKKRIQPLWLALSVLLSLAILALCILAGRGGTLHLQPNGEPEEVMTTFLNALVTGEYRSAYACLSDYSSLGLENEPESESGRTLYQALRQSYGFRLLGDGLGVLVVQGFLRRLFLRFRSRKNLFLQ